MARKNRKRMIEGIVSALKAYDPEKVYLFGSWARGEADRLSDIDLVIVKDTQAGFFHRLQEAAACLPEDWDPERVYLFGSWARGEADRLSDIDLVIVKDTQAGFFHRLKEAAACLPEDWGPVDVLVYTPDELRRMEEEGNAFVEMLLEEGELIYEK